ncbi:MAG: hypothetical protein JW993_00490 [Sedimentisphaerales bacterium]|nr:hypothetical protein [Sedimentisphaerales bacterium]
MIANAARNDGNVTALDPNGCRDNMWKVRRSGSTSLLADQIPWLISLRWMAVGLIVAGALIGTHVFPLLANPVPLYSLAGLLFACNLVYVVLARGWRRRRRWKHTVLTMVQMEVDLIVLTAVLHVSGGVVNPFIFFYVFHVIIATILLPRHLSFAVGITTIFLFGLLAANEMNAGALFGYYPLQLSSGGGVWRNPVYGLAGFVAFACTVVLAQYLTAMIIGRMTSKEREAARNSELLNAIINAMSEGLVFITGDGGVSLCNPAARRWQDGSEPDGNGGLGAFPRALAEHIQSLVRSNNGQAHCEQTISFGTGGQDRRFIEATSHPVMHLDGATLGHVIVGQDLTEHKKLETELRDRTDQVTAINERLKVSSVQMAQREKMVALGHMAAGIAHEIGNPLTSLSSVVQYLGRKCTDPEQKEMCAVLDRHVGRISVILKRMLSLARPVTSEYKWVDINELIENTLSLVRFDRRAQGVRIVNAHNADLPTVWLSPQNLEQCLLNIVINAFDAMEAKGRDHDHVLEIRKSVEDETIELRVSDTGVGMSPEVCRRAFESFFTTKEISKGTGLGLFVSYNLLAEIDGTIELESQPGRGTTVIIRIPIRPKKGLIAGPSPVTTGAGAAK